MNIFLPLIKQKFYSNQVPSNIFETAWTLGGTAANISYGIIPWTNPSNVLVDSTSTAVATGTGSFDYTDKLRVTNFGFSIPTGATITGIGARFRKYASTNNDIKDDTVQLVLSASAIGADKSTIAFWNNVAEVSEYGGTGDLWSWVSATPSNINNSSFGVEIAAMDDSAGIDNCYIEAVWLKIFYTV